VERVDARLPLAIIVQAETCFQVFANLSVASAVELTSKAADCMIEILFLGVGEGKVQIEYSFCSWVVVEIVDNRRDQYRFAATRYPVEPEEGGRVLYPPGVPGVSEKPLACSAMPLRESFVEVCGWVGSGQPPHNLMMEVGGKKLLVLLIYVRDYSKGLTNDCSNTVALAHHLDAPARTKAFPY